MSLDQKLLLLRYSRNLTLSWHDQLPPLVLFHVPIPNDLQLRLLVILQISSTRVHLVTS